MKRGWEIRKLGEVLIIERGGSPRPIKKYLTNSTDGINWVKISDATASDKYIYETKEKITRDGLHKTRVVNEGDFILSNSMSFGRPYIMKTTGCIHDGWLVLKQNGKKIFETEFLYYLLSSPFVFQQFNSKAAGSTVRNLNIALVSSVNVPIPPLPEQKRIVAILDKAFLAIDKAKANAEKNLANAKELFESYLNGIFENPGEDWEEKRIQEITKVINGYAFPSKEFKPTNSIKSIKITNVGVKEFVEETDNYLPEKYKDTLKEVQVDEGGIVIALTRTIISTGLKVAIIPKSYNGALVNQRVAALVPKEKTINQKYLYNYFITDGVVKYILAHVNTLMQPNLSITDLKNMMVPCPPLTEQKRIVAKLDALSAETKRLEKNYQQKIADTEELKKSILQKAFKGKL